MRNITDIRKLSGEWAVGFFSFKATYYPKLTFQSSTKLPKIRVRKFGEKILFYINYILPYIKSYPTSICNEKRLPQVKVKKERLNKYLNAHEESDN